MRFRELLLEYDRGKTIANYHDALIARLGADNSFLHPFTVEEARLDPRLIERAVEEFENADPTSNKRYTRWIVAHYINGRIKRFEDLFRVRNALVTLDAARRSGYFARNPGWAPEVTDFSRMTSLQTLEDAMEVIKHDDGTLSKRQEDKALERRLIADGDAIIHYNDATWKIITPKTPEAATYFGRNTKWCTTAENGNMFHRYASRGDLYILLNKPSNTRWQFHFRDGQFADEQDNEISLSKFPTEVWTLIDWPFDQLPDHEQAFMIRNIPDAAAVEAIMKKCDSDFLLCLYLYSLDLSVNHDYRKVSKLIRKTVLSRNNDIRIVTIEKNGFRFRASARITDFYLEELMQGIEEGSAGTICRTLIRDKSYTDLVHELRMVQSVIHTENDNWVIRSNDNVMTFDGANFRYYHWNSFVDSIERASRSDPDIGKRFDVASKYLINPYRDR